MGARRLWCMSNVVVDVRAREDAVLARSKPPSGSLDPRGTHPALKMTPLRDGLATYLGSSIASSPA